MGGWQFQGRSPIIGTSSNGVGEPTMDESTQRKLFSALSHGAIFFSSTIVSLGIPILIWAFTQDSVVKANAKESLNFHINLYILGIIFGLLSLLLIGLPLLLILVAFSIIMPIFAIVQILDNPDSPYRYPFILRLF